jgi:hypothetical protein
MSKREEDEWSKCKGIFGAECALGDAMGNFESAQTRTDKEGVVIRGACNRCGDTHKVVVEWAELIALKYGLSPHVAFHGTNGVLQSLTAWMYDNEQHAWYPTGLRCHCGETYTVYLTAGEGEGHMRTARQRGFIPPQAEAQLSKHASDVSQRMRGA